MPRAKRSSKKKTNKSKRMSKTPKISTRYSRVDIPRMSYARKYTIGPAEVNMNMSLSDLQDIAKSKGIPFGGLSKSKLIRKINNYY